MKFFVLLFALAVCANAQRPSSIVVKTEIVEKIEIQSASATIVSELLETTFHVPTEFAKEIGHIFRNVPLSLVKEMAALLSSSRSLAIPPQTHWTRSHNTPLKPLTYLDKSGSILMPTRSLPSLLARSSLH